MNTTTRIAIVVLGAVLATGAVAAQDVLCSTGGGVDCSALIPDGRGGVPGVLTSTLVAPDLCGGRVFGDVDVALALRHDWLGDLEVRLVAPDGRSTVLYTNESTEPGGTRAWDIVGIYADGASGSYFEDQVPSNSGFVPPTPPGLFTGGFVGPQGSLAGLAGQSTAGTWTLEVTDRANSGVGALDDWGLTFLCGAKPMVSIAATVPEALEQPTTSGWFTVTRSTAEPEPLTVNVWFSGTAAPDADYPGIVIPVVIPGGAASVELEVAPIPDGAFEGSETVVGTLYWGTDYDLGAPSEATVTILDRQPTVPGIPIHGPLGTVLLVLLLAGAGIATLRRVGGG